METVAVLFLVPIIGLQHPSRCTYDSNEYVYGMWRQILRGFYIKQLVRIVDNQHLKMKSVFQRYLLTSRSTSGFNEYQETFPGFLASLKEATSVVPPSGTINVDPDIPSVINLLPEIKVIIFSVNKFMKPFLMIFGRGGVNSLSPFSFDLDSPSDPIKFIEYLFQTPNRDLRDNPKHWNSIYPYDNGDIEEDFYVNNTCDKIAGFVKIIQSLNLDKDKYQKIIDSADADENHYSYKKSRLKIFLLRRWQYYIDCIERFFGIQ